MESQTRKPSSSTEPPTSWCTRLSTRPSGCQSLKRWRAPVQLSRPTSARCPRSPVEQPFSQTLMIRVPSLNRSWRPRVLICPECEPMGSVERGIYLGCGRRGDSRRVSGGCGEAKQAAGWISLTENDAASRRKDKDGASSATSCRTRRTSRKDKQITHATPWIGTASNVTEALRGPRWFHRPRFSVRCSRRRYR